MSTSGVRPLARLLACSPIRLLASAALVLGACAQASSPPGGTPDRSPPRIIETTPAQGAVATGFSGPVTIKFDETLSERGPRESDMVLVSPETGEVDVDRSGKELKVRIAGGWQSGRVYHVTVLPGLQDRRGNGRADAYQLVFSTGPEILPTVLGGLVADRLTGRPVTNARVQAISQVDSTVYVTVTDTGGFFAFRSLPLGAFQATAFIDANRNRKLDDREARDVKGLTVARDTPVVEFSVLAPDTTPARLVRADARDSLQVRLTFDDFIAAEESLAAVAVSTWLLPDSTATPGGRVLRQRDFDATRRAVRDSLVPAPVLRGGARPDSTRVLPAQELVFVPFLPLRPETRYRIRISGIRNIAGVPDGGGSVTFETPAKMRLLPKDTSAVKPVQPDTAVRRQ
jgi:hypothetical protein